MINVLRIGHRIYRDKRITTHVALVARAFGADRILIDKKDDQLKDNIRSVCQRFGGDFKIETGISVKKIIKDWSGIIVHLTMYGEELGKSIDRIDKDKDLLVIIGAEKVTPDFYDIADFNVSVGNQPHSEVAALAIFLDRYNNGSWKDREFNGKIKIIPCNNGKNVISQEE